MLLDCFLILDSVEWLQGRLEEKLLEIDAIEDDNKVELLRKQVLSLLAGLRREERRMDEYMAKYKKLVYEEKALLSRPVKKRPIYLRGVPPHSSRQAQSSQVAS